MSDIETGGPAFPWCGDLNDCPTINLGMDLRDYFAAKAMQGELAAQSEVEGFYNNVDALAVLSYRIADAMLKARKS